MALEKKDFYGKEVAVAIQNACDALGVAQEKLEIEVIEAGSTGIFGLIRKKAHIRVSVKADIEEAIADVFEVDSMLSVEPAVAIESQPESAIAEPKIETKAEPKKSRPKKSSSRPVKTKPVAPAEEKNVQVDMNDVDDDDDEIETGKEPELEVSPESLEIVRAELLQLVELMGFPSALEVEAVGQTVSCTLRGEFEENLTGVDGKVLDSLQYILRKIISRKVPERLRISINVGEFREQRLEELKVKAVELATQVKEDGKTQVLPALNPSERRVIHMILQEDKEIRSRSVGDGLFKKILIYKPGKGGRPPGRKRPQSKGRANKSGPKKNSDS